MPFTAPLRLALFDCDGTLVDSQHAIVAAMEEACRTVGLTPLDAPAVRRIIGLSLPHAVAELFPDHDAALRAEIVEEYKQAFHRNRSSGVHVDPLYPGILDALAALEAEGTLLGVATGKSRRGLDAVLAHHGLADRFVTLHTADDGPGKPAPDMVLRALSATGVAPAGAVMIGDTVFDIAMARNAGIASIGVAWGYHHVTDLQEAGADRLIDRADAVPTTVRDLLAGA